MAMQLLRNHSTGINPLPVKLLCCTLQPSSMYEAMRLICCRHIVVFHGNSHRRIDGVWEAAQTTQNHDQHQDYLALGAPNRRKRCCLVLIPKGEAARAICRRNLKQNLEEGEVTIDTIAVRRDILSRAHELVLLPATDQKHRHGQVGDVLGEVPSRLALQRVISSEDRLLDAFRPAGNVQLSLSTLPDDCRKSHCHDCGCGRQVHHHAQKEGRSL
mmetsp:Transcript_80936/g.205670  ORF Transcript_80936/g.205670 Transcript_80936/m.205670 type:complete len:215 (+) Transcript_80936:22-666(+)